MISVVRGSASGEDASLVAGTSGFDLTTSDPFASVRRFFQGHSQEEWLNKGLSFQEGTVFTVEGTGDVEEKIHSIMQRALQQCPKRSEQLQFWKATEPLMRKLNIEEPSIELILEEGGAEISCRLPLSFCVKSETLFSMLAGETFLEASTVPVIRLPQGVSRETFDLYLDVVSKEGFSILSNYSLTAKEIASLTSLWLYFGLDKDLAVLDQSLQEHRVFIKDLESQESLQTAITNVLSYGLGCYELSLIGCFISSYVAQTAQRGIPIREIIETLSSLKINDEPLSSYRCPCALDFFGAHLSDADLEDLSHILAQVESLNLSGYKCLSKIPILWTESLRRLDISKSGFVDIAPLSAFHSLQFLDVSNSWVRNLPAGLENLKELVMRSCIALTDFSSLGGGHSLRKLYIIDSSIKRLPAGLKNLEELHVTYCRNLRDISALDGSLSLKSLHISSDRITKIPVLKNLEELDVRSKHLNDISALDASTSLRSLHIADAEIRRLPLWLWNLKELHVISCEQLTEIVLPGESHPLKELHIEKCKVAALPTNLRNLEALSIDNCIFTDIPIECRPSKRLSIARISFTEIPIDWIRPSLEEFEARACPNLRDISALSGCRFLKKLRVSQSLIARLPMGLNSLEELEVWGCKELIDFSPLARHPALKVFVVWNSSIAGIPAELSMLEELIVRNCTDLRDVSSLKNSPFLKFLDVTDSSVRKLPINLMQLECLRVAGCKDISDDAISALAGSSSLKTLDISGTKVTAIPHGLKSLGKLFARQCRDLTDISSLEGSRALQSLCFSETRILAIPPGLHNLVELDATNSANFQDISSLAGLRLLIALDISGTKVAAIPPGLENLEFFRVDVGNPYLKDVFHLKDCWTRDMRFMVQLPKVSKESLENLQLSMISGRISRGVHNLLVDAVLEVVSRSLWNQLCWGYWLFQGMPIPFVQDQLFDVNRNRDLLRRCVDCYMQHRSQFLSENEILVLQQLPVHLEEAAEDIQERRAIIRGLSGNPALIFKKTLARALGISENALDVYMEDNPNDPRIDETAQNILNALVERGIVADPQPYWESFKQAMGCSVERRRIYPVVGFDWD